MDEPLTYRVFPLVTSDKLSTGVSIKLTRDASEWAELMAAGDKLRSELRRGAMNAVNQWEDSAYMETDSGGTE